MSSPTSRQNFSLLNIIIMKKFSYKAGMCLLLTGVIFLNGCKKEIQTTQTTKEEIVVSKQVNALKNFTQVNLVGNNDEYDPAFIDPGLVNAWGIAFTGNGIAWVN